MARPLLTTRRLHLRAPSENDAEFHHRLHSDERLYRHAPSTARVDPERNLAELRGWIDHWAREGFGYGIVTDHDGQEVGVAGVRRDGDALNLYYRFTPEAQRQGLAREMVGAILAWLAEHRAAEPVHAVIRVRNVASVRTAQACGLFPTEEVDLGGGRTASGSTLGRWTRPRVEVVAPDAIDATFADALTEHWYTVARAGGSVGFWPGVEPDEVRGVVTRALADTLRGRRVLVTMTTPAGELVGLGWWVPGDDVTTRHVATLRGLQVHPSVRHRGLGRQLLAGMHALARDHTGAELLTLEYPQGTGLGTFFSGAGYVEESRRAGAIRLAPDDERAAVTMTRALVHTRAARAVDPA